jgi:hypothetical protein
MRDPKLRFDHFAIPVMNAEVAYGFRRLQSHGVACSSADWPSITARALIERWIHGQA